MVNRKSISKMIMIEWVKGRESTRGEQRESEFACQFVPHFFFFLTFISHHSSRCIVLGVSGVIM